MTFDEATLRKLEQLTLVADQVRVGMMKGDRRSSKRGTSIEFADYRNYVKGDDLRRLDWNVYARLERPFIKLLEEEEDLSVHILVDASLSMNWPEHVPEWHKLEYATKLAAGLGHIALSSGDQVTMTFLRSDENRKWGPYRGAPNSMRLFQFLQAASEASGITDLNLSLQNYALRGGRPGLLLLFTDLMSEKGYELGLNALQARGYEVAIFHIISPDELEPIFDGDVKLIDSETGVEAEITLDAATIDAYKARVESWRQEIATHCGNRNAHYIPVETDQPWEELVLQSLRQQQILK